VRQRGEAARVLGVARLVRPSPEPWNRAIVLGIAPPEYQSAALALRRCVEIGGRDITAVSEKGTMV